MKEKVKVSNLHKSFGDLDVLCGIDAEIKEALIKAMEVTAEEFDLFKV